jgi:hypothetical protein
MSIVLFALTSAGFLVALGLWTYADAKIRTDKPGIWTLIVLLVPNLMGLIIYLLVGRNKMEEMEQAEKKARRLKKVLIALAICFALATGLVIGAFVFIDSQKLPTMSGVSIGTVETYWDRQWSISFKTSGEEFSKTVNMSDDDLAAFSVTGNCESGKLYLRISQGETMKDIDVSDSFSGAVDLSGFRAGLVELTIHNDEARNGSISISWRA